MDIILFAVVAGAFVVLLLLDRRLLRGNRRRPYRPRAKATYQPVRIDNFEEQQHEYLERQLEAVTRETVKFSVTRVVGRGEYNLYRAALGVTRQPLPSGTYPFYVFPQVSLGQIIRTAAPVDWHADLAHRAINSKRCDLLIADWKGKPVAVLEYRGRGHNIGGTAERRDRIKRIALERAGVRYVEIKDGATPAEIQAAIRELLTAASLRHQEVKLPWPKYSPGLDTTVVGPLANADRPFTLSHGRKFLNRSAAHSVKQVEC